jgi:hypothetical protein
MPESVEIPEEAVEAVAARIAWRRVDKTAGSWRRFAKGDLEAAYPALEAHWQTKPEIRRLLANERKATLNDLGKRLLGEKMVDEVGDQLARAEPEHDIGELAVEILEVVLAILENPSA